MKLIKTRALAVVHQRTRVTTTALSLFKNLRENAIVKMKNDQTYKLRILSFDSFKSLTNVSSLQKAKFNITTSTVSWNKLKIKWYKQ
jgi:hypothetical protein